jgi:hypothetical protein
MLAKHAYFDQETRSKLIDYSLEVESLKTPDEVLNKLDEITSEKNPIRAQGANRFSVKLGDASHRTRQECLHPSRCSERMGGGVGRIGRERARSWAHDRTKLTCPLHVDGAYATA